MADTQPYNTDSTIVDALQSTLSGLMIIEQRTIYDRGERPRVQFGGQLVEGDQDEIFDEIVTRCAELGYTPMLRKENELYILEVLPVVPDGRTGKAWVNIVLFIATILSVLFIGATRELDSLEALIEQPSLLLNGWPFAATIMAILTAHEFSHYFMGLRYGSPTSLPYFIPLPFNILGTMGAVIVQRGPMRSRKALFDIGIAGPIGGLVIAIPLLFYGIATSEVGHPAQFMDIPQGEPIPLMQEGNSLLYYGAKYLIHGQALPNQETGEDLWLSPPSKGGSIAFAAWAGLLVTSLNLLPIGQLDGGHVAYALWGRKAWKLASIIVYVLFGWGLYLTITGNPAGGMWLLWGFLSSVFGPRHPPPLNDVTPLDKRRKILGWVMVAIFILIVIPVPLVVTTL